MKILTAEEANTLSHKMGSIQPAIKEAVAYIESQIKAAIAHGAFVLSIQATKFNDDVQFALTQILSQSGYKVVKKPGTIEINWIK